jgi:thiamine kinase-like enzyme
MASTIHLTPEDIAARSRRAIEAATGAGRELGVRVREPKVLHDMFSVVVQLAPAPVVVRVPVVLPPAFDLQLMAARQQRELDTVAWLSEHGLPVVRPSPLLPRKPVQRDGFSMTFWEYVEVDKGVPPDYVADAALVPKLHLALRGYPEPLPFMAPLSMTMPGCLERLEREPELLATADRERVQREWRALEHVLSTREAFVTAFPNARVQAIHGDAPSYNLIRTSSGIRYADFEDVSLAPIEWDLALLGADATDAYDTAAARAGLPKLDPDVLRIMDAARMLQLVACLALVPELPMLATGLAPSVEQWRSMPFAGGMTA